MSWMLNTREVVTAVHRDHLMEFKKSCFDTHLFLFCINPQWKQMGQFCYFLKDIFIDCAGLSSSVHGLSMTSSKDYIATGTKPHIRMNLQGHWGTNKYMGLRIFRLHQINLSTMQEQHVLYLLTLKQKHFYKFVLVTMAAKFCTVKDLKTVW